MVAPPRAGAGVPIDFDAARARLGVRLSAEQVDKLAKFVALLQRWNATYNLTAVRDPASMLTHHVFDCLTVIQPLRRELGDPAGKRLLDVGSGAGLPGVVLATAIPDLQVVCVDAVGKKSAFVQQVAAELHLQNLTALHGRVEKLAATGFDVIVSRAYAALPAFVSTTRKLLRPGGRWLAMKGKIPTAEIAALPPGVEAFHVEQVVVPGLAAERCLVWMKALH
jgi:16S rRNA (guanine527-N7)-methyltransferase